MPNLSNLSPAMKTALRYLMTNRYFGGKHTEEHNVFRRVRHLNAKDQKIFYEEYEACVKTGWIHKKRSTGEWHISLDTKFLAEIVRAVE